MKQIEIGEWLHFGCFISKQEHPLLIGKYQVFKNDKEQTNIGRAKTLKEASNMAKENKSNDNYLKF